MCLRTLSPWILGKHTHNAHALFIEQTRVSYLDVHQSGACDGVEQKHWTGAADSLQNKEPNRPRSIYSEKDSDEHEVEASRYEQEENRC